MKMHRAHHAKENSSKLTQIKQFDGKGIFQKLSRWEEIPDPQREYQMANSLEGHEKEYTRQKKTRASQDI